jgi:hypothetical protein
MPLLKPRKPAEDVTSYRPISLLPILSKLFEKLLLTRVHPILHDNQILPDHQFGFRRKRATIEQVHRVVNVINTAMETDKYCTDISQAFDKVWHEGLLCKHKTIFPAGVHQIFKSYLANRQFLIKYRETDTSLHPILSGLPHCSFLGPPLYVIYTSDLPTTDKSYTADLPTTDKSYTATFADDTAIPTVHEDPDEATELQAHVNKIHSWLIKWRMKANEIKSTQITFTLKKRTCPPVYLNNKQLPQKNEVKCLGFHLDRRLTWRQHILMKRKQLDQKLRSLYWIIGRKSQLSLPNKLLVYTLTLKPIWTYGIQLWCCASNSHLDILERFQSKGLQMLTNAPWFLPNAIIRNDERVTTIRQEVKKYKI